MRLKYPPVLAAFLLAGSAHAQITIGQAEMPHANDQLVQVKAVTNPLVNYAATGPSHTWNFGNLAAAQGDTAKYQTVASTNFLYAIVYADVFFNQNRANQANKGVDIPFSNLLPIANPYTFRYLSGSVYRTVGFGAEVSGVPVPIIFDEKDVVYELPLQFGNSSSSHSSYHLSIPNVGYYGYKQDRTNTVDGWGSITTPGGSWDVLRVKTVISGRDSIGGFGISRPVTREYKWLAQGLRVPVLQINTTAVFGGEVVTGIWYYDVPRTITVEQPLASTLCPGAQLSVYYAATGSFNAGGFFIPANQFRAQLSDANGSFANPVVIGSAQATASGTISATVPVNTPAGTGYRIRVVSTSPAYTGAVSTMSITIGGATTAAISASGPPQICTGEAIQLTAVGGPGYQWKRDGADIPGATNATYEAAEAGSYTVVVANNCGTATSAAITVVLNAAPQLAVEHTAATTCAGAASLLSVTDAASAAGTAYQWFLNNAPIAGATGTEINASLQGQYTMEATNGAGCSTVSEPIFLTVDDPATPVLTADGSTSFCQGGSVMLTADSPSAHSYLWMHDGAAIDGATGASVSAAAAGTYEVMAVSANGCLSAAAGTTLVVNTVPEPPVIAALGGTVLCGAASLQLSVPDNGDGVQWLLDGVEVPGGTGTVLTAHAGGSYSAIYTSAAGCSSASSGPVAITEAPLPAIPHMAATEPTGFCEGGSTLLVADLVDGVTYQWLRNGEAIAGANGSDYLATTDGFYTVEVASAAGCTATGDPQIQVTVYSAPEQPVITQVADGLAASGTGDFQWFQDGTAIPGATAALLLPPASGWYSVSVTNADGCTSASEPWHYLITAVDVRQQGAERVFPNPNAGRFTLEVPNAAERAFEVRNLTGQLVRSGTLASAQTRFELGALADGAYFIRITGQEGSRVVRFVVQH